MKITTKEMVLVSIFTALTAIGASISIPMGEVPITMQTLFVLMSGIILGPKLAVLSQITYLILGLIGIPIFAGFTGGIQSIMKPSFGFILGFVFAAYIVGKIANPAKAFSSKRIWIACLAGTIVIYLVGLPYMYYVLNIIMVKGLSFSAVLQMGCILFLPGDLIKLALASTISIKLLPMLNLQGLKV